VNRYLSVLCSRSAFRICSIGKVTVNQNPPLVVTENVRYLVLYPWAAIVDRDVWPQLLSSRLIGISYSGSLTLPYWEHARSLLYSYTVNIKELSLNLGAQKFLNQEFDYFIFAMGVLGPSIQHLIIDCEATTTSTGPIAGISVVKRYLSNLRSVRLIALDEWTSEWAMELGDYDGWSARETLQKIHFDRCTLSFSHLTQFIREMKRLDQVFLSGCIPSDAHAHQQTQIRLPVGRTLDISCHGTLVEVITE
jgi:hypothetical protein